MSTAVVPPPNSSSLVSRLPRRIPHLTARVRALLTAMNLHFAGVAFLLVLALYFVLHLVFVLQALNANNAAAIDQQRVELRAAEVAAKPLRGLDKKLVQSTADADAFYQQRLPYAVSQVAAELGAVAKREGVRQTRTQYAYAPLLNGNDALTEMKMDAAISGDYRSIVHFINAMERDRMFFDINGINLTGQQTGQVNLRIRLTTYLRAPNGDEGNTVMAIPAADDAAAGGAR
jgi:type IV pilus assembly protein PilO